MHLVIGGDGGPPPLSMIPKHFTHFSHSGPRGSASTNSAYLGSTVSEKNPVEDVFNESQPQILSKSELRAWRLMGFPFNRQWKAAVTQTTEHGLELKKNQIPSSVNMFTEPKVLLARMRCLPFHRSLSRLASAVGHLIWIDFHGPLVRSRIHQFVGHFSIIDDYSPAHNTQSQADTIKGVELLCKLNEHEYQGRFAAVRSFQSPCAITKPCICDTQSQAGTMKCMCFLFRSVKNI